MTWHVRVHPQISSVVAMMGNQKQATCGISVRLGTLGNSNFFGLTLEDKHEYRDIFIHYNRIILR